jgi:hypothetical protein
MEHLVVEDVVFHEIQNHKVTIRAPLTMKNRYKPGDNLRVVLRGSYEKPMHFISTITDVIITKDDVYFSLDSKERIEK